VRFFFKNLPRICKQGRQKNSSPSLRSECPASWIRSFTKQKFSRKVAKPPRIKKIKAEKLLRHKRLYSTAKRGKERLDKMDSRFRENDKGRRQGTKLT